MIILSTDSLRGYGLNRIFELAKQAAYEGLDLAVDFSQYDTCNTEYLKRLISETGLPVQAVSAPDHCSANRIKELAIMTKEIGAKILILQPPKFHEFKVASWFKQEIPKFREKYGISIALENAPAGTFLGFIPDHAMSNTEDLKKFKHVSLDTARIGEKRQDLIRIYAALRKYLVHIHLSNVSHGKKYALPTEGIMPLESFLTKLKQDNYPGSISIKVLPRLLSAGNDEKVVEALGKAKKYYDKYYAKVEVLAENTKEATEDKEIDA